MKSAEIREKFLKYFESKGHIRVPSASLVPVNDPTLFFTNAGMVPFKDLFTGRERREYQRAVSSQKCLRVSGKHNDLENVGRTPRHHTFFEMLGNFSFGGYFKKEAIAYGWEFLTKEMGISPDCLWVTIFRDDDEAFELWRKDIGVPGKKIVRCGEKDNFWSMGETGPCGPCSEIYIDLKKYHEGKAAAGDPSTNDADFMELWNLVFMQYDRDSTGKMTPLPHPSIDTGMGLERLAAVLQKKQTNFETDLFWLLIQAVSKGTGKKYGENPDHDVSMRVMADHIRSAVFLIADGVQPSNEGRGYVLRRIMRRAIRHSRLLGKASPFFVDLVDPLIDLMKDSYPELIKNRELVRQVTQVEEERFLETLDNGLSLIGEEIAVLRKRQQKILSGKVAFKLYDTFGFPADLTELIAGEAGLSVDMKGFETEMDKQRDRARAHWKGSGSQSVEEVYHQILKGSPKSLFVGYDRLEGESTVLSLLVNGHQVGEAEEGSPVEVIVEKTPFYGESGGQVGDKGIICTDSSEVLVEDTQRPLEGIISHRGHVKCGTIKVGDRVSLNVSSHLRGPTMVNHTATHVMHAALREILGTHVRQAGSLVEPTRLRFDFAHFEPVKEKQIEEIERRVNEVVQSNYPVTTEEMSHDAAIRCGALAFFGDKYGDQVRVVTIGSTSKEFCGGTHLPASGNIGAFKIVSEGSVASGVRRVEAITGLSALGEFQRLKNQHRHLADILKTTPDELPERIKKLSDRVKDLERELREVKTRQAAGSVSSQGGDVMSRVKNINGVKVLTMETEIDDPKALRELADQLRNRIGSGIVAVGSKSGGKVLLLVSVTGDLSQKYHAGKLIAEIAPIVGGRGGGQAHMAEAGGTLPDKLPEALRKIEEMI